MRKTLICLAFAAISFCAQAQVTFGIHGNGILASMQNDSDDDESLNGTTGDFKSRFSWKVGVVAEMPIGEQFSFMPQLNLLSKGGKIDRSISDFGFEFKLKGDANLLYLELPLNFVYNATPGEGGFFIGAGPSLSYGLGGKMKLDITVDNESESMDFDAKFDGKENTDETFDNEEVHFKAFELGANFIAGYKLPSGLFFNAHYNMGLSNISPDEGSKTKNRYFGFGIGYMFGGGGNARK